MQAENENVRRNKLFVFCLLSVGFAVLISNIISKDVANVTTDFLMAVLSGGLLVLSIIIAVQFRLGGGHGKAYLLFAGFASLWFAAELTWLNSEVISRLLPFPEQGDWFYLSGYSLLFVFSMYYLKPFRLAISNKLLGYAALASLMFFIPTIYSTYSLNRDASIFEILWGAVYPIADTMILFPAVLGVLLFIKGKVGLFWSFTCIAIILNIIADSGFFFLDIDKSSYSSNPINILYMWSYILFAFGIYSHVKLFKKPKMKSFGKTDDLK